MKLTRKQFELLVYLTENRNCNKTQREIQKELKYSLGTINKLLKQLTALGYVEKNGITIKV